jgi:hypothetical protein
MKIQINDLVAVGNPLGITTGDIVDAVISPSNMEAVFYSKDGCYWFISAEYYTLIPEESKKTGRDFNIVDQYISDLRKMARLD